MLERFIGAVHDLFYKALRDRITLTSRADDKTCDNAQGKRDMEVERCAFAKVAFNFDPAANPFKIVADNIKPDTAARDIANLFSR